MSLSDWILCKSLSYSSIRVIIKKFEHQIQILVNEHDSGSNCINKTYKVDIYKVFSDSLICTVSFIQRSKQVSIFRTDGKMVILLSCPRKLISRQLKLLIFHANLQVCSNGFLLTNN